MRCAYFVLLVLMTVFSGCRPTAEERGLSVAQTYIEIPPTAQAVRTLYFGEGQWRTDYLKFDLPETDLDDFLATTCFVSQSDFYDQYPHERGGLSLYPGRPDWWLTSETKLVLEGRCDSEGISLGLGISKQMTVATVYLLLFFP